MIDHLVGAQLGQGEGEGGKDKHGEAWNGADRDRLRRGRCPAAFEHALDLPKDVPRLGSQFLASRCGTRSRVVSVEQPHATPSLEGGQTLTG